MKLKIIMLSMLVSSFIVPVGATGTTSTHPMKNSRSKVIHDISGELEQLTQQREKLLKQLQEIESRIREINHTKLQVEALEKRDAQAARDHSEQYATEMRNYDKNRTLKNRVEEAIDRKAEYELEMQRYAAGRG